MSADTTESTASTTTSATIHSKRDSGPPRRSSGSLATSKAKRRYWSIMAGLIVASLAIAFGLLAWDNPMPITDE
ncbi:MAG: iron chelate uptake ABC transporter family permease subunit, partial [Brevibacterium aurantiacum]